MLPVKKIYVDSKYKTPDSISDSNFKFQLPQTVALPDDCSFFISDVCIPHSWYTINDFNCNLYLRTFDGSGVQNDYILTLAKQSYNGATFATQLASKIQTATSIAPTVSYDVTKNTLSLYIGTLEFQFLTDRELQDPAAFTLGGFGWNGTSYDANDLKSANGIISNTGNQSVAYININQKACILNLQPIRNVYIHSTNLGNYDTIGSRGEQTIIKKVPVNNNYSEMIFSDYTSGGYDMLDCSKQTLRQLHFIITNVDGVEIPFNGSHVSFSVVFHKSN